MSCIGKQHPCIDRILARAPIKRTDFLLAFLLDFLLAFLLGFLLAFLLDFLLGFLLPSFGAAAAAAAAFFLPITGRPLPWSRLGVDQTAVCCYKVTGLSGVGQNARHANVRGWNLINRMEVERSRTQG